MREQVTTTGEAVVIHDVTHDRRIADAPLTVQSLVMVPLKFGDQVIGTLELEHHKRRVYRSKDVVTINTFANQLATAIHITELRRPCLGRQRVERAAQEIHEAEDQRCGDDDRKPQLHDPRRPAPRIHRQFSWSEGQVPRRNGFALIGRHFYASAGAPFCHPTSFSTLRVLCARWPRSHGML